MSGAPSILIAAGGTGGHIFPGIAVADAVKRLSPNSRIAFVGTERGLESTLIPDAGYPLHLISMRPLERRVSPAAARAMASVGRATMQAKRIIRHRAADVVVGMGGYPSLPTIAAARLARVPAIVHESGAVAGLANKVAARLTTNVALAFEEAAKDFPSRVRPRVVGMPLRHEIAHMDRASLRVEARKAFDLTDGAAALLVMGGSLGALRLNRVALELAARWKGRDDVHIILKAGRDHLADAQTELERVGAAERVTAVAFLDRMELAYAAADIGLCRAGAGTVAELPAAGLGAVLVPYPHAPGNHQMLNAQPLARVGAAIVVGDAEADATRIGPLLEELLSQPERMHAMGEKAKSLAKPQAAEDLAGWVLELAGGKRL